MALEASLIMLDNSAYGLNGDYLPTRWQSQVDSASLLIQAKLQSNLQSSVGLGIMGGKQVQILCTMTSDSNKINSYLFGVKIHGELHFTQALQIGALALKHRLDETQKQRLIFFIGSIIAEDAQTLKVFAKKLKKNNIAVDLICFGDCSLQQKNKVQVFMNTIQHQNNSHSIFIQPGDIYLSDKLLGSQIFNGGGHGMMGPGNIQQEDPQLAQAIRMSLQESVIQNQQPQAVSQDPNMAVIQQQRQPTEQQLQQLAIRLSLQEAENQGQKKEEQDKKDEKKNEKKQQQ